MASTIKERLSGEATWFAVVCLHCGSLSIRPEDCAVGATTTIIRCGTCDSPRGTRQGLQDLANSNRRDLFDSWSDMGLTAGVRADSR